MHQQKQVMNYGPAVMRAHNFTLDCYLPLFALDHLSLFLFLRNEELCTGLFEKLPGIGLREAWTYDTGTMAIGCALESAILIGGLYDDVVVLHDEEEGELLPTRDHLVTLLTAIVRQELDALLSGGQSEGLGLDLGL